MPTQWFRKTSPSTFFQDSILLSISFNFYLFFCVQQSSKKQFFIWEKLMTLKIGFDSLVDLKSGLSSYKWFNILTCISTLKSYLGFAGPNPDARVFVKVSNFLFILVGFKFQRSLLVWEEFLGQTFYLKVLWVFIDLTNF